tara:strand:- start:683 stop:787 length:105 start_codon:yes stop_codon:yes gene_type:complete
MAADQPAGPLPMMIVFSILDGAFPLLEAELMIQS